MPAGAFAIPTRFGHLVVESNVRNEAVGFGEVLDVPKNLGLQAVDVAPVALGGERVAVQVRLNVASGAGVGVVPPGAAEPIGLLEDHEVGGSRGAEAGSHAEPSETGAEDGDVVMLHGHGIMRLR